MRSRLQQKPVINRDKKAAPGGAMRNLGSLVRVCVAASSLLAFAAPVATQPTDAREEVLRGLTLLHEFEYEDATINGVIDRIGPILSGGTRITDFKTGNPDRAGKVEENLQLGIYYLAVLECEDLAAFRPVRAVELAFLKGDWRTGDLVPKVWQVSQRSEEQYQTNVRVALSQLIAEKKRLNDEEVYRPRPEADCYWCDFKTLCPLYPEGATPLLPTELAGAPR